MTAVIVKFKIGFKTVKDVVVPSTDAADGNTEAGAAAGGSSSAAASCASEEGSAAKRPAEDEGGEPNVTKKQKLDTEAADKA
jgi:hypothetical protein